MAALPVEPESPLATLHHNRAGLTTLEIDRAIQTLARDRVLSRGWLQILFVLAPVALVLSCAGLITPMWSVSAALFLGVLLSMPLAYRRAHAAETRLLNDGWHGVRCPACFYEPGSDELRVCPECGHILYRGDDSTATPRSLPEQDP